MLTLAYVLQPLPGWATVTLTDGAQRVELEAAWSTDVLGDLVEGCVDLLAGGTGLRVVLDAETSEAVLLADRDGDDAVVQVRERVPGADGDGPALLTTRTTVRRLAEQVAGACTALRAAHGEDGYQAQWGEHPFPRVALGRLQAALRA